MSVEIDDSAREDIAQILRYLAARNITAARKFAVQVYAEFQLLEAHPGFGAIVEGLPKRLAGIRRWRIRRFRVYLVFYRPTQAGIEVMRVLHGARNVRRIIRKS